MRALSLFVSERPWQLFGLSLPKGSATTLQLLTVSLDQGRSRSVAPAQSILRPPTRYKGRSAIRPGPSCDVCTYPSAARVLPRSST
jgi:hypothetical protein